MSVPDEQPCSVCGEPMEEDDGGIVCFWCREAAEDGYEGETDA